MDTGELQAAASRSIARVTGARAGIVTATYRLSGISVLIFSEMDEVIV